MNRKISAFVAFHMDVNKCLPPELTVESVDDILYRIGLSFDSIRDRLKRKLIHPMIVFFIQSLYLTQRIITISLNEDNHLIFIALGSLGYFIGVRQHFDLFSILISILGLISQLVYYYIFRNGIKPTFLQLFRMMSGLVPPKSIGLTDEQEIIKLTKFTVKFYYLLNFITNYLQTYLSFLADFMFYLFLTKPLEVLFFGIPNVVVFGLFTRYFYNFFLNQLLVFYVICLYLKIKINSLNERLIEMKRRKRFIRIGETLQSFDSLYSEISEYNTTFWSKFLAVFWLTFGLIVALVRYITIFVPMVIFMKLVFNYGLLVLITSFLLVIFTASSVTYCANHSYKTFNSLFISYSKHNKHRYYIRTVTKLKVNSFIRVNELSLIFNYLDKFVHRKGG